MHSTLFTAVALACWWFGQSVQLIQGPSANGFDYEDQIPGSMSPEHCDCSRSLPPIGRKQYIWPDGNLQKSLGANTKVLVLGDSTTNAEYGYGAALSDILALHDIGTMHVIVEWTEGYCGTSFVLVQCLDKSSLAFSAPFDVIVFNWGLHDDSQDLSPYADVNNKEYVHNMVVVYKKLFAHLKPGGTMLWHSTVPVGLSGGGNGKGVVETIVRRNHMVYNKFHQLNLKVETLDLFTATVKFVRRECPKYPFEADCPNMQANSSDTEVHYPHFYDRAKQFQAELVAKFILKALN